ncbi:MAG: rhodanese-like domain-containing protein [Candidatus Altimarinota bacterium]
MISQDQLLKTYDQRPNNYYLLDVRSPLEFADHRIPGSINIPIDELEKRIGEIPLNRHIIVLCEHGVRSTLAERFLKEKEYMVDQLENGLVAWKGQLDKGAPKA